MGGGGTSPDGARRGVRFVSVGDQLKESKGRNRNSCRNTANTISTGSADNKHKGRIKEVPTLKCAGET